MREEHLSTLSDLVAMLADGGVVSLGAIEWASPVLVFGNLLKSRVATLGLNPSNIEFVDRRGKELLEPNNRFETLRSLNIDGWNCATRENIETILGGCDSYFDLSNRPYHAWFRPLDKVIAGLGVSFYSELFPACHLDLVPFATEKKWASLSQSARRSLIDISSPSLIDTLKASNIVVLVLNGASVVREFEQVIDIEFEKSHVSDWDLGRKNVPNVRGFSFVARISSIRGIDLGRDVLVLGFNHNIQSSFGVKAAVVESISGWISKQVKLFGVLI